MKEKHHIDCLREQLKIKSKSLIATIFGDVVVPFGGQIWLENLIQICLPLGVNERLVRTSLYRLCEDDWVESEKQGRRSFYHLTDNGVKQTALAERKIYGLNQRHWNGQWTLVFLVIREFSAEKLRLIERSLRWLGFGLITKHVWGHPNADDEQLASMIDELGINDSVVCMHSENLHNSGWDLTLSDPELAQLCTPLDEVAHWYQNFIHVFSPYLEIGVDKWAVSEQLSLRVLLVDEFRKIVLKDPYLAPELLPEDWIGYKAFELCGALYLKVVSNTNRYYIEHFQCHRLAASVVEQYEYRFNKS